MRDPREQQAWQEVGHTAVSSTLARAIVAWFLVVMAALPLAERMAGRLAAPAEGTPSPWARLFALPGTIGAALDAPRDAAGSIFWDRVVPANRATLAALSAFETDLEDRSAVGRALRPPAQAVLSRWLGAGNERVYIGRDGWLFFRSDVESVTGPGFLEPSSLARRAAAASELTKAPTADSRPAIIDFARDLATRGITLVVVPAPVKPTIHPDRLTRRLTAADAPLHNRSYAAWIDELRQAGVLVFDPTPGLLAAGASGPPAYLETDTHWRPHAMEATAEALAAFVTGQVSLPAVAPPGYRVEPREARQPGDTAAMLEVWSALLPPRAETVSLRMVLQADGDPWRPSRDADVLVLGDSFSNIYSLPAMGWGEAAGFVEHLSLALGRPVDRIVQNDNGASATRLALARDPARLVATRVVVWQFAARELVSGDWAPAPLAPR